MVLKISLSGKIFNIMFELGLIIGNNFDINSVLEVFKGHFHVDIHFCKFCILIIKK